MREADVLFYQIVFPSNHSGVALEGLARGVLRSPFRRAETIVEASSNINRKPSAVETSDQLP